MKLWQDARVPLTVTALFCAFVGGVLLAAYVLRNASSPHERCERRSVESHRNCQLVYRGPYTSKSIPREAFSDCECS